MHLRALSIPGYRGAILRATHTSLVGSTLVTFENQIVGPAMASGDVTWFGGSGRKPAAYNYSNGSTIVVGGLDSPGKFLSTEFTDVLIDEANQVSLTAYETLLARLRHASPTYHQMVTLTNPDHPEHYLRQRALEGKINMVTSFHRDNPRLVNLDGTFTADGVEYLSRLDALSGVRRARFRDGLWVAAEGQIWDGWSQDTHVIDPFQVPAEWRTVWSWDQGFQNPQVFQRWAVDGDGRMFLTHELSVRQRLVEDFAKDLLELKERHGWSWPEVFVADHDGGDRATMERHLGFTTTKARKSVGPGIQAVAQRLVTQKDGRARLFVFRDAVVNRDPLAASDKRPRGLAAEIGGYVWQTIRGTDGVPQEQPQKIHDHSMDTMRYAVMYLDQPQSRAGSPARGSNPVSAALSQRFGNNLGKTVNPYGNK